MKILVCGNGWLGNIIKDYLQADMSEQRIENIYHDVAPYDAVINCAAKTNIDWCEINKLQAMETNTIAAARLAKVCDRFGKKYVFLSSACIFESLYEKDWKDERSTPNPKCFYAQTKAIAEQLVTEVCPNALIVRIRLPISETPHPRNTLTKLHKYKRLHTNQESVTVVEDMLPALAKLISTDAKGVFHLINEGTVSPQQIGYKLGLDFVAIDKFILDEELERQGRAKRVTTLVDSTRSLKLPPISKRLPEIVASYKNNEMTNPII